MPQADARRGLAQATPAGARAGEHGPDQGDAGCLARQPADHLDPPAGLPEGSLQQVGVADAAPVLGGEAQVGGEAGQERSADWPAGLPVRCAACPSALGWSCFSFRSRSRSTLRRRLSSPTRGATTSQCTHSRTSTSPARSRSRSSRKIQKRSSTAPGSHSPHISLTPASVPAHRGNAVGARH